MFTCTKTKEVHSFSPTKSLKFVFTYFLEVGADPACVHLLSRIALSVNKPQRGPVSRFKPGRSVGAVFTTLLLIVSVSSPQTGDLSPVFTSCTWTCAAAK